MNYVTFFSDYQKCLLQALADVLRMFQIGMYVPTNFQENLKVEWSARPPPRELLQF